MPSVFSKDPNKGIQFGLSRDAYAKTYVETNPPLSKDGPGPGAYQLPKTIGKVGPSYSLRVKAEDTAMLNTARSIPGPGYYPISTTFNGSGKFFYSKYKSPGAATFGPASTVQAGKRCIILLMNFVDSDIPGPGYYPEAFPTSKNGNYFLSKYHSTGCTRITPGSCTSLKPNSSSFLFQLSNS